MRASDYRRIDVADVYRQGHLVGCLKRTNDGTEFDYDEEFLSARPFGDEGVAWSMPPSSLPYLGSGESLPPFFANLAPEGGRLAATIGRLHTSPDDLMTVLLAVGADCIGDIQIVPEGEELPAVNRPEKQNPEDIDLEELFSEAVGGEELERASLPGVQEKISSSVVSFPARFGFGKSPTIIKINPRRFPLLVENEAFFLTVAKKAGIEVNEWKLISDKTGRSGIVIKRFDRLIQKSSIAMLHQEDACQLLDRYPWQKYRITMKEVATAVSQTATSSRREILRLLRLYCFSYLIGNADLHAKNVSLVKTESGTVELTPGYDLLSTLPYADLDTRMAMSMDGRDDNFSSRNFEEFGERWEVPVEVVRKMTREVVDAVSAELPLLNDIGFEDKQMARLESVITRRLEKFNYKFG